MDATILDQVARILKIPVEAIENFNEELAINIIANTFNEDAFISNSGGNLHLKLVQLHDEKIALYECMLKEKDEMMARFEKLNEGK